MTDYTELVKALRCCQFGECGCGKCYYKELKGDWCTEDNHPEFFDCDDKLKLDAAAAIEALQAQLPKRGKWIIDGAYTYNLRELNGKAYEPVYRCSCCNRQTESYVRLDEPKMPEDADFPEYCPHCGAKMEVQE